jgi:hypothetical protein
MLTVIRQTLIPLNTSVTDSLDIYSAGVSGNIMDKILNRLLRFWMEGRIIKTILLKLADYYLVGT